MIRAFAPAVDRMQPFLLNLQTRGGSWRIHNRMRAQVLVRMDPIRTALPTLWPFILAESERVLGSSTGGSRA